MGEALVGVTVELKGCHGIYLEEKEHPQPFEIEAVLFSDIEAAAAKDRLEDHFNYEEVVEITRRVFTSRSFNSLEALAKSIANELSSFAAKLPVFVSKIRVSVAKKAPPYPGLKRSYVVVEEDVQREAYLLFGSNVGDRLSYLRSAYEALPFPKRASSVYETEPVGGPPRQRPHLNMVAEIKTSLHPLKLLELCQRIEQAAGRRRRIVDGPRTLDVDVLLYGGLTIREGPILLPHPRLYERRFALIPLAELAPEKVSKEDVEKAKGWVMRLGPLSLFH